MMIEKKINRFSKGSALVVVLLVVMVTTILALSFIRSSDSEVTITKNLTDQISVELAARAGMEHARSFIMRPWDVDLGTDAYWRGIHSCQLDGNIKYNVSVTQAASGYTPECNYDIVSVGYNTSNNSRCQIKSQLRLDPAVAMWVGGVWLTNIETRIYGDLCAHGSVSKSTTVYGDSFITFGINRAEVKGSKVKQNPLPLSPISIKPEDYSSSYYINGNTYYVETIDTSLQNNLNLSPSPSNPAGVFYCDGSLRLGSNNHIKGTVIVRDKCYLTGGNNYINSTRNFPALVIGDELCFDSKGASLQVSGLVEITKGISVEHLVKKFTLDVTGCLVILENGFIGLADEAKITVRVDPAKAAVQIWDSPSLHREWINVCGGYFKTFKRE